MASRAAGYEARERLVAGHVARRTRDDDLLAVRGRADARRDDDVHADVALVAELGLARVDADPEAKRLVGRPWLGGERALDLGCGGDRVARAREREEDAVAGPVDLRAAVLGRGRADELAHARPGGSEALAEEVEQPRRPLDVGEERASPCPPGARDRAWRGSSTRTSVGARPRTSTGRDCEGLGVHCPAVFDTLSDKLQATLGGLGRGGRLDEDAISKAMREIRLALLEADVNLEVARDFTARGQGARARPGRPRRASRRASRS